MWSLPVSNSSSTIARYSTKPRRCTCKDDQPRLESLEALATLHYSVSSDHLVIARIRGRAFGTDCPSPQVSEHHSPNLQIVSPTFYRWFTRQWTVDHWTDYLAWWAHWRSPMLSLSSERSIFEHSPHPWPIVKCPISAARKAAELALKWIQALNFDSSCLLLVATSSSLTTLVIISCFLYKDN